MLNKIKKGLMAIGRFLKKFLMSIGRFAKNHKVITGIIALVLIAALVAAFLHPSEIKTRCRLIQRLRSPE